jgi:hypothetical protein
MEYSDAVITSDQSVNKSLNGLFEKMARAKKVDTFEKGDSFTDSYFNLYNELVG